MKPLSVSIFPGLLLSARFVRFCGRKSDCIVFVTCTAGAQLLFAASKVFTQLLRSPRLAFRLSLLCLFAGSSLPGRQRLLQGFIVIIVHKRCHKRISRGSTVSVAFFRKVW